jgi:hypothetical protein
VAAFQPGPSDQLSGWRYGCDPAFLRVFQRHWLKEGRVEAAQDALNGFPQFAATIAPDIGGLDLAVETPTASPDYAAGRVR